MRLHFILRALIHLAGEGNFALEMSRNQVHNALSSMTSLGWKNQKEDEL
jgi:hypothetical protein